jgi:hypothetical protein
MYKSVDGGKTWTHIGLEDSQHIARIAVHPQNPDIVYVAALGHAYGSNEMRGIFKSIDGGKTWQKILFKDNKAGAIDLVFDPNNPHILFAALWERSARRESDERRTGEWFMIRRRGNVERLEGHGLPSESGAHRGFRFRRGCQSSLRDH